MCPKSKKVLLEHTRLVSRSVVNNLIASFFDRKRYKDHRIALTRIAQGNSIGLPIRDTAQQCLDKLTKAKRAVSQASHKLDPIILQNNVLVTKLLKIDTRKQPQYLNRMPMISQHSKQKKQLQKVDNRILYAKIAQQMHQMKTKQDFLHEAQTHYKIVKHLRKVKPLKHKINMSESVKKSAQLRLFR